MSISETSDSWRFSEFLRIFYTFIPGNFSPEGYNLISTSRRTSLILSVRARGQDFTPSIQLWNVRLYRLKKLTFHWTSEIVCKHNVGVVLHWGASISESKLFQFMSKGKAIFRDGTDWAYFETLISKGRSKICAPEALGKYITATELYRLCGGTMRQQLLP